MFKFVGTPVGAGGLVWALILALGKNENASRKVTRKRAGEFIGTGASGLG
jgi:hypothetical protein